MAGALCFLSNQNRPSFRLLTPENAAALDKEAAAWGLHSFALVEAAGRSCAAELIKELGANPYLAKCLAGPLLVCAGSGNNGADALVMLRTLLVSEKPMNNPSLENRPYKAAALLSRFPAPEENTPRAAAVKALQSMGVPVIAWNGEEKAADIFCEAALIIDGITGTGAQGPLEGIALEMLKAINKRRNSLAGYAQGAHCCVVSIDVPSGASSAWKSNTPAVQADFTLAIEPLKTVLYTPALRPLCGKIIPVKKIFPPELLKKYGDAELLCWEECRTGIAPVPPDAYKYTRGVAEIHAGSTGSAGAARIAAAGASAAGAGMVRLVLDDPLYPVLASAFGGIMAVPASAYSFEGTAGINAEAEKRPPGNRHKPDAVLLGPGWGRGEGRLAVLRQAMEAETLGTPLILDADGLVLLKVLYPDVCRNDSSTALFHGNAILTPHAGEMEALSGIPKERLLSEPSLVSAAAKKLNSVILFKSHVMVIAGPDGRLGFVDGMDPALGAGGSGDLLAGLCAGIAARDRITSEQKGGRFDPYRVAAAAGTLLAAASRRMGRRFHDPLDLAEHAAVLAGEAWLP